MRNRKSSPTATAAPAPNGAAISRDDTSRGECRPFPVADVVGRPIFPHRLTPDINRLRAGQRHVDIVALHARSERSPINMRLGRRLYRFADWALLATIVSAGITLAVGMFAWGIL